MRFRRQSFLLRTIDPSVVWGGDNVQVRYRVISRLEIGGAYKRRLAAIGGHRPIQPETGWCPTDGPSTERAPADCLLTKNSELTMVILDLRDTAILHLRNSSLEKS